MSNNKSNNRKKPTTGKRPYHKAPANSNKRNSNNSGVRDDVTKNEMGQSVTNDISWYSHYPELTVNAGKLSMLYPAGMKMKFVKDDSVSISSKLMTVASNVHDVPGIMALEYIPTYGFSDSIKSPLTQMSRTTFNNMVAATNRVPNYEYTDLTVYQIAMTNLIQFYYWMCRIYLVAGTYSSVNLAWNKAVFKALDVDGTNIIANRSLLYSYIITFARRISAFPFPKSFDLFNRTATLVSNIYTDGADPKDQMYVFVPKGVYRWDTDTTVGASKLTFEKYTANAGYSDIVRLGNRLLDSLQGSSDVQMMTADILKVYANDLVGVNVPPENGTINAVYDATILTQIMNAKSLGVSDVTKFANLDITQSTDEAVLEPYMVSKPQIPVSSVSNATIVMSCLRDMVNFLVPNPSEGTVLEGTRFMFVGGLDSTNANYVISSFGSEIIINMAIYVAADDTPDSTFTKLNLGPAALSSDSNVAKLLSALSNFDWHPRVAVFQFSNNTSTYSYLGSNWDCSNYAFVTDQQIKLMNDAAMFNLMKAFG